MNAAIGPAVIHCFHICIFESSLFSVLLEVLVPSLDRVPPGTVCPLAAETGRESSVPHTSLKKPQRRLGLFWPLALKLIAEFLN